MARFVSRRAPYLVACSGVTAAVWHVLEAARIAEQLAGHGSMSLPSRGRS